MGYYCKKFFRPKKIGANYMIPVSGAFVKFVAVDVAVVVVVVVVVVSVVVVASIVVVSSAIVVTVVLSSFTAPLFSVVVSKD